MDNNISMRIIRLKLLPRILLLLLCSVILIFIMAATVVDEPSLLSTEPPIRTLPPKSSRLHQIKTDLDTSVLTRAGCSTYSEQLGSRWEVRMNVFNSSYREDAGVSLVTHGDGGRISNLPLLLQYWKGAISVALFLNSSHIERETQRLAALLRGRHNVAIHVVLQDHTKSRMYYPANLLRNIAVQGSTGSHLFLLDMDFIPMKYSHDVLQKYAKSIAEHQVFVVPAFEFISNAYDTAALDGKSALKSALEDNQNLASPFHDKKAGHRVTNFDKWWRTQTQYDIMYEYYFEPYVLMRRTDLIEYPEEFLGRYYNKISLFHTLAGKRYRFTVLPDVYVIHIYHPTIQSSHLAKHKICSEAVWSWYKASLDQQPPVSIYLRYLISAIIERLDALTH